MGIPQLEQCCCGYQLRTGTKFVGWIGVVSILLEHILQSLYNVCLVLTKESTQQRRAYFKEFALGGANPSAEQRTVRDLSLIHI